MLGQELPDAHDLGELGVQVKQESKPLDSLVGIGVRDRAGAFVRGVAPDFESGASADSATPASGAILPLSH